MISRVSQALGANIPTIFNILMLLTGKNQTIPMAPAMGGQGGGSAGGGMGGMGGGLGNLIGMVGNMLGGGGGGDLMKMFGMGGGDEDEEEPEEDEDASYFKVPKKKKYRNRPVSQAQPAGFDMADLANMFGGGQNQQAVNDEELPNMGFGLGAGAPGAGNFNQGPAVARPTASNIGPKANMDNYSGLYDELSTPNQGSTTGPPVQTIDPSGGYTNVFDSGAPAGTPQSQPQPRSQQVQQTIITTPPVEMSQPEPEPMDNLIPNVAEEPAPPEEVYETFTPDKFQEYSEEELNKMLHEGQKAKESADSYLASVQENLKKKGKVKKTK
jgi:hypothetical protein